jgi:serine/threonine protein kinase
MMNNSDYHHNVSDWFCTPQAQQEIRPPTGHANYALARGAFGEVKIAIHTPTDQLKWSFLAVKSIVLKTTNKNRWGMPQEESGVKLPRAVFNEICALRLLNPHPNIVELKAVYPQSDKSIGLAFSYCPSDLYTTLEWRRCALLPPLSFPVILGIACDLFSALQHCHSHGCLHLDVKPGNLLVTSQGTIQICDFGLAQPCQDKVKMTAEIADPTGLCTLYYRPPELLFGSPVVTASVDMYSAGLVCCELLVGFPILRGKYYSTSQWNLNPSSKSSNIYLLFLRRKCIGTACFHL